MAYGVCQTALGRYEAAERFLLEAHEILTAAVGAEHAQTRKAITDLVDLYEARGRTDLADEWRARLARTSRSAPLPSGPNEDGGVSG